MNEETVSIDHRKLSSEDPSESIKPNPESVGQTLSIGLDEPSSFDPIASQSIRWLVVNHGDKGRKPAQPKSGPVYQLSNLVGRGGMGEVWEATQESLGRKVAIKRIRDKEGRAKPSGNPHITRSFKHEALITACLDHPNIVPIYDIGEDEDGSPLMAMKLVKGKSWSALLKEDLGKDFQERLVTHLPILIDVAQATAFAHSRGIIHRDLKPAQVMLGEFGEVMLLDWGMACSFRPAGVSSGDSLPEQKHLLDVSRAPNPAGTPVYMAPEQTEMTPDRLGPWTDIFLLGAILYQLLTDTVPYPSHSSAKSMARAHKYDLDKPETRVTDNRRLPRELVRICEKAMAEKPWERYGSAQEFVSDLQRFAIDFGKRRESAELLNEAVSVLSSRLVRIRDLYRCTELLAGARILWEENPELLEIERQLHRRFLSQALADKNWPMARDFAMVSDDPEKTLRHIEAAEDEESQIAIERKRYAIATALLLLISLAAVLIAIDRQREVIVLNQELSTPAAETVIKGQ